MKKHKANELLIAVLSVTMTLGGMCLYNHMQDDMDEKDKNSFSSNSSKVLDDTSISDDSSSEDIVLQDVVINSSNTSFDNSSTSEVYSQIRLLEEETETDIFELNSLINKYCSYSKYSYEEAVKVLSDNIDSLKNDYNCISAGIMEILFENAEEEGRLSIYCEDYLVERYFDVFYNAYDDIDQYSLMLQQREKQEEIMIDICNDYGMSNEEKALVLSIFRLETGNGNDTRCVYDNNYGGIKLPGDNYTYCIYQTPEFGMYKSIKCMYGHIKEAESNGYTDPYSIIYAMSVPYNYEFPEDWSREVIGIYENVNNDYNYFIDKEKTLTR